MIEQYKIKKEENKINIQNDKLKIYFIETIAIKQDSGMTRVYSAISERSFFNQIHNKN